VVKLLGTITNRNRWGNIYLKNGEVGQNTTTLSYGGHPVATGAMPTDFEVKSISCGAANCVILLTDGTVYGY
jgi:hypothetical protein